LFGVNLGENWVENNKRRTKQTLLADRETDSSFQPAVNISRIIPEREN
jgi:hypothetical protein